MLKKTLHIVCIFIFAATVLGLTAGGADAQTAYPTRPVALVASGGPGGGADIMARSIEQALTAEKLIDQPFQISNKGGGGGNMTTSYLVEHKGSGYVIAVNSNRVILNELLGTIAYGLKAVTPIARLVSEYPGWVVRADSKYKTALDVLADLQKDPKSVVFALTTVASNDQFNILLPAKQKGIDYTKIQTVAITVGGEAISQLLGGHIPIMSTSLSEMVTHVTAGKLRVLSIASESRIDRFPGVPTWRELGIDVVIPHWRGIYGPPDMPKIAYDYWIKKLGQMTKTKTWKDMLVRYELHDTFLPGDSFRKLLEKDEETFVELIGSMGMLKRGKK